MPRKTEISEETASVRIGKETSKMPNWIILWLFSLAGSLLIGAFQVGSFQASTKESLNRHTSEVKDLKDKLDTIEKLLFSMSTNRDERFNGMEDVIDKHRIRAGHPVMEERQDNTEKRLDKLEKEIQRLKRR